MLIAQRSLTPSLSRKTFSLLERLPHRSGCNLGIFVEPFFLCISTSFFTRNENRTVRTRRTDARLQRTWLVLMMLSWLVGIRTGLLQNSHGVDRYRMCASRTKEPNRTTLQSHCYIYIHYNAQRYGLIIINYGRSQLELCSQIYHHRCGVPSATATLRSAKLVISVGDAGVGKSSLLIRLTDQRFLANPDPTVRPVACHRIHTSHLTRPTPAWRRVRLQTHHHTRGGQSRQIAVYVSPTPQSWLRSPLALQAGTPRAPSPFAPSHALITVVLRAVSSSTT
jgi:hypothetical protein